jgi:hypothetical protein
MSTALAPATFAEIPTAGAAVWTGLIGLAVAMGIGRFAFTPLLPLMQQDAGVSLLQGSWLATANYVGYLVGASICVSSRRRRRAPSSGGWFRSRYSPWAWD